MPVTPPQQVFRSTVQNATGPIDNTSTTTAASVITTKVQFPALTTGIRKFQPQATATATATIPSAPATFSGVGWRMDADISTEKVATYASTNWSCTIGLQQDSGTNLQGTVTVIAFLDGAEVGRGTSSGATLNGTTTVSFGVTIAIPSVVQSSTSNPRLQFEVYFTATGLNTNAVSSTNISLVLNVTSTVTPGQLSVAYVRTASETPTATDSASRTNSTTRTASESTGQTDTATRVFTGSRRTSDSHGTSDAATRQPAYARISAETLSAMAETAARAQTDFRRAVDSEAIPVDSPSRVVTTTRTSSETTGITDVAQKTITYGRTTREYFAPADPPVTVPDRAIRGYVRNSDGTIFYGGATVYLVRDSDGYICGVQTSSVFDGSYVFLRDHTDTATYHVEGYATVGGIAEQDTTERGLVPT